MTGTKKQIITIAGRPGSGKSTTAKNIAATLGFEHFSSGDLFREAAKKQGKDVLSANQDAEKAEGVSPIDHLVDQRLREIGESNNQIVIDSRTAWHWIPNSFRVFLDLDLQTAAGRILGDKTPERIAAEHIPSDPAGYAVMLEERLASEARRYKRIYNVDPYDAANYDLIVDTKVYGIEDAVALIIKHYKAWQEA
jgi:cytidylate kinase